ncbi:hypothetical protein CLF_108135 [Clonorchis sinensis]|uniref:Uncharacterized protein n=1 Tax=Clonorchis sinensis TaxID=79923 RepID=G7YHN7_CLOSI|nr:hypothetical protein CLF_108135 [Clonorchis sinensis]
MNCTNTNKLMPHRPSRGAVSRVALPAVDSREPFARHMAPTSSGISRSAFKLPHPAYMAAFNLRTLKQARPQASLALTLDSLGIADGDRAWLKTLQDMAVNVVSGDLVVSFYPDCLSECLEAFIIIIMNTMCSTLMLRCRTNKSWLYGGKASMLDDVIMLLMMMFNDHVDDNAIMIIAVSAINLFLFVQGEYIDCTFSSVFGLSTMAAAGLGNWVSDLCGIGAPFANLHGCVKIYGKLSPQFTTSNFVIDVIMEGSPAASSAYGVEVLLECSLTDIEYTEDSSFRI